MTDPENANKTDVTDAGRDPTPAELPSDGSIESLGVAEDFREVTDGDLSSSGTNQNTMGEASGGVDLDDLDGA